MVTAKIAHFHPEEKVADGTTTVTEKDTVPRATIEAAVEAAADPPTMAEHQAAQLF